MLDFAGQTRIAQDRGAWKLETKLIVQYIQGIYAIVHCTKVSALNSAEFGDSEENEFKDSFLLQNTFVKRYVEARVSWYSHMHKSAFWIDAPIDSSVKYM